MYHAVVPTHPFPFRLVILLACAIGSTAVLMAGPMDVRINEIHYHPAGNDQELEFVELLNTGSGVADLSGCSLSQGIDYVFPEGTLLGEGAYLVVARNAELCRVVFGAIALLGDFTGNLSDGGETIRLLDAAGRIIDELAWRDSADWPQIADGRGASLEKLRPRAETGWPDAWASSMVVNGTPGRRNSRSVAGDRWTLIDIGERWWYLKGTREPAGDWTAPAFDPVGWSQGSSSFGYGASGIGTVLDDMRGAYTTVYFRHAFDLPIDPGAVQSMTLRIDYDDGFVAYLNGTEVARSANITGAPPAHDAVAGAAHDAGRPEAFDLSVWKNLLTEGRNCLAIHGLNVTRTSSDFLMAPELFVTETVPGVPEGVTILVEINEIVASASGGWIELFNAGDATWDISGYYVSTTPQDPRLYAVPDGSTIAPGAFLVIDGADLGGAVPPAGSVIVTDPSGRFLVDGREYSLVSRPDGAYARYPDGTGEFNTVLTATRGAPNDPPPQWGVVINEIMYHPETAPGEPESEWIELLNTGTDPVDLSGWRFTRGIDYAVPAGLVFSPGTHLVIARDPERVEAEYGITGVRGGYESRLQNDDEVILLRDVLGNVADRVHYADDGAWPLAPDGGGPSLELTHPHHDNRCGQAWEAAEGSGTPGRRNSVFQIEARPIIQRVRHRPAVPTATQPVSIACAVSCPTAAIASVELGWRRDGDGAFTVIPMHDDGASDDGAAEDGVYGALVDPAPDGAVVCFYIVAASTAGTSRVVPPARDGDTAVTMLYQVQDNLPEWNHPTYRIIMTQATVAELEARSVWSDGLLDATFLAGDAIFYNVGCRYRGRTARVAPVKSYRVKFPDDTEFLGLKRVNLNSYSPERQHLGMKIFRAADVPASRTRMVRVVFNNEPVVRYVHTEAVDDHFLTHRFEEDDEGNLYRAFLEADLSYRGSDKEQYREHYLKRTNEELDDYTDVIDLCDAFTNTPEEAFAEVIAERIDVEEWARFFAVHTAINMHDGVYRSEGDDYFLYRRGVDGRFVIIPWDVNWSFTNPAEPILRPSIDAIERFMQIAAFARHYYRALDDLWGGHLSHEAMNSMADDLAGVLSDRREEQFRTFSEARRPVIEARTRSGLTAELDPLLLVRAGETGRYLMGTAEPSSQEFAWTTTVFDDGAWEEGPGGYGYGDGDDGTVLEDMRGRSSTVYLRKRFHVDDPASLGAVVLSIDFDDGFVAYLNGSEIARANVPGEPGSMVPHDALATAAREAGVPATYVLEHAGQFVRAGENVLAIQGVNEALWSSDFSLAPSLGMGVIVTEVCSGSAYVAGARLTVEGAAPVMDTAYVRVNGVVVPHDPFTGRFSAVVPLIPGSTPLVVEAVRENGNVVRSVSFDLTGVSSVGGTAGAATMFEASASPYYVGTTLTVPAGHRLTIGPGVELFLEGGASIVVYGGLQVLGTEEAPVSFDRRSCGDPWGGIRLTEAHEENRFVWSTIRGVVPQSGSRGALAARECTLALDHCLLEEIAGVGIDADSCGIEILSCEFRGINGGVRVHGCRPARFDRVHLHDMTGEAPAIDIGECQQPPATIHRCLIEGAGGSGIEARSSSIRATGNEVRDCGGPAIRLDGPGQSRMNQNVISRNQGGLFISGGHNGLLDHNTVADNSDAGIACYEHAAGRGGGSAAVRNSIVYFNAEPYSLDAQSTMDFEYCVLDRDPLPPGDENFNEDPRFVDRQGGDYGLADGSPCIARGQNGTDVGARSYRKIPVAPSDLRGTGTSATSVTLQWHDRSATETGFELHRTAPGEADFSLRAELAADAEGAVDEGLLTGETYVYRLRSFNDHGSSPWSNEVSITPGTIPQAPGDLAVTHVAPTAISLAWEDRAADEDGFQVYRRGPGDGSFAPLAETGPGVTQFVDQDPPLEEDAVYRYRVRAFNGAGVSGWSNEVSQRTGRLPQAPGDLRIVRVESTAITLAWTDNADNETSHTVAMRYGSDQPWQLRAVLGPNVTTFADSGLRAGRTYDYRVRAENEAGVSAWTDSVSQAVGTPPVALGDVSVADVGLDWILLVWQPDTHDASFEIERRVAGAAFSPCAVLESDAASYRDTDLTSGTRYSYRLRRTSLAGSSPWSPVLTARTGTLPPRPATLRVIGVTVQAISLAWDHEGGGVTRFEVLRSEADGTGAVTVSVPGDTLTFTDTGLAPGTAYSYRLRAINRFGASAWSSEVTSNTGTLPEAPADVAVAETGEDFVALLWEDRSEDELYFEIERRLASDNQWWIVAWASPDRTHFIDRGLPPRHEFYYRVRAWNAFGPSAYSNEVYAATLAEPVPPPRRLREVSWSATTIELAWERNGGEHSFVIRRRRGAAGALTVADVVPGNADRWIDRDVVAGVPYTYVVNAVTDFGLSAPSNTVTTAAGIAILAISPDVGDIEGGETVTVQGIHFSPSTVVALGSQLLQGQAWIDEQTVAGVTPSGRRVGATDVRANDDPFSAVLKEGYHYARNLLRGDVTGDTRLDVADAVAAVHFIFGEGPGPYCAGLADVTTDGAVTIEDAVFLLLYLFDYGPPPMPARLDCR